jgi:hypothetical protein
MKTVSPVLFFFLCSKIATRGGDVRYPWQLDFGLLRMSLLHGDFFLQKKPEKNKEVGSKAYHENIPT